MATTQQHRVSRSSSCSSSGSSRRTSSGSNSSISTSTRTSPSKRSTGAATGTSTALRSGSITTRTTCSLFLVLWILSVRCATLGLPVAICGTLWSVLFRHSRLQICAIVRLPGWERRAWSAAPVLPVIIFVWLSLVIDATVGPSRYKEHRAKMKRRSWYCGERLGKSAIMCEEIEFVLMLALLLATRTRVTGRAKAAAENSDKANRNMSVSYATCEPYARVSSVAQTGITCYLSCTPCLYCFGRHFQARRCDGRFCSLFQAGVRVRGLEVYNCSSYAAEFGLWSRHML